MKTVIYKKFGSLYTTPESNFNTRISNTRLEHKIEFKTPEEVIEYYCKWFTAKPEDFIIDDSAKEREE